MAQFLVTVSILALTLYGMFFVCLIGEQKEKTENRLTLAIIPLPFGHVTVLILFTSIWTGVVAIPSTGLVPLYLRGRPYPTIVIIESAALALWLAVFITTIVSLHRVGHNYGASIRSAWISTIVLSVLEG